MVLQQRIAALKASRDKLIGAFDAQAAEVERLSVDNAALAEVRPRAVARAALGAQDALLGSSIALPSSPHGSVCGVASVALVAVSLSVGSPTFAAFQTCVAAAPDRGFWLPALPPLQSLVHLRDVAAKWEAQAQDSLAQNERLKDLLEESATWSVPSTAATTAPAAGPASSAAEQGTAAAAAAASARQPAGTAGGDVGEAAPPAAGSGTGKDGALAALCQRFERELLLEKAKTAQLDLQVRSGGRHGMQKGGAPPAVRRQLEPYPRTV